MLRTPKILIVGPDPKLPKEIEAALEGISDVRAVSHCAPGFRQAVETARSRCPDLVLLEVSKDFHVLKAFAEEIALASPGTVVAAIYHAESLGSNFSESTLLLEAMRCGVRDCFRRPLSSADLQQLFDRFLQKPASKPLPQGAVVSFIANKGGVGKSTLSVNVACMLARRVRQPVLLIDASLQMGTCAAMLNLRPTTTLTDMVRERHRLDETLIRQLVLPHDCGVDLLAAPANAIEAAEVDDEAMSRIITLARRVYPYVLVDTFPMLDRVMMGVVDLSDRVFIVLESVVPTILGAAQFLEVLDGLGLPKNRQSVVLNRFSNFAGNIKPEGVALRLGRPVDHVVPYEKKLLVAANIGSPYILAPSRFFSRFPRAISELVDEIEELLVPSVVPASNPVSSDASAPAPTDNHKVIP